MIHYTTWPRTGTLYLDKSACELAEGSDCYAFDPAINAPETLDLVDGQLIEDAGLKEENDDRLELEAERDNLQAYLRSTDWYAMRKADQGTEIPMEVSLARQEARDRISDINEELA